jgi:hypothetical protein
VAIRKIARTKVRTSPDAAAIAGKTFGAGGMNETNSKTVQKPI